MSRERRWTPGPWFIRRWSANAGMRIHGALGVVAQVFDRGQRDANARLIAAAPELLEALEEAIEWDSHDSEGVPAVWLEQAKRAIAKAYGETE